MNARGADLIAFWREWPMGNGVYHDDSPFSMNDADVLCVVDDIGNPIAPVDPDVTYSFNYGVLGWQGDGPQPAAFDSDLVRVFRRWLKARTVATLVVEVPRDAAATARALIEAQGWKITHG